MTQDELAAFFVNTVVGGNVLGKLHDLLVQERDAKLQRMRHAHLVCLEQDVARQPHVHIQILFLGKLAAVGNLLVVLGAHLGGVLAGVISGLEHLVDLGGIEHLCLTHIPTLGNLGAFRQEVVALKVGEMLNERAQGATYAERHALLKGAHLGGVLVPLIAGKQLVGTLARKDDGDLLGSHLRQIVQRHAGQVRLRFVHVILDIGQRIEELVGGNHLAHILDAQLVGKLGSVVGLVEVLVIEADRIRGVGHKAGGNVAGVHAARKKRAHLNIGDSVRSDAFVHDLVALVHVLLEGLGVVVGEVTAPVTLDVHGVGRQVIRKAMRRGKLEHALKEGLLRGGELQRQVGA